MTKDDVKNLIVNSRKAQTSWAVLPYREKVRCFKKAGRFLAENRNEIVETISRENGKLASDALAAELIPAMTALPYYTRLGRRFLKPEKIRGGSVLMFNKKSRLFYRPWGVVGIISPWNYPFSIPFSEVVMALLAGNGVILKTASLTPGAGRAIASMLGAAGLPEGLFAAVELPGKEAGPAFIEGGVDKLFFTGATETGRELMALAAPGLLPLTLELGGADAAIIRGDADLDRAVWGIIWAGFSNAGQSCGGAQRVLVHRRVYDEFLEKLSAAVESLRPGNGPSCDLGPMISPKQKKEFQTQIEACLVSGARIAAQSGTADVSDGKGGVVRAGSLDDSGLFAPAIVLTGVKADMPVMSGEIFGSVIAVVPVENDDEALEIANASSYGLSASVWSRDRTRAKKIAACLNAGSVMINDHLMSHGLAETPWGGFGDSGLGRTHGEPGFREMLKTTVVIDDTLPGAKRNPWWQPYSEKVYSGLNSLADLLGGPGLGKRLRAVPGTIKFFLRSWDRSGKK